MVLLEPTDWLPFLVSVAVSATVIHAFSPVARRIGLVDQPDDRKRHHQPVPLIGGIAIFCGTIFGLAASDEGLGPLRALVAGMGMLLLVGLLDDFRELSARSRFLAQIAAATLMATWGGVRLEDFGFLLGPGVLSLGIASLPVTVFCTVGVINAVNMIDGLDGLAGSLVLLCLVALGFQWAVAGSAREVVLMIATAGGIVGFLLFNLRLGRSGGAVFMGDAGSLSLGFLLAWLLIDGSQAPDRVFAPVTALWLLAVPLVDTVYVMIRRMRAGRSPFAPGRDHLHHLFARSGFGAWATLAWMLGWALVLAVTGLALERSGISESTRFLAFLSLCAAYYLWVDRAWTSGRWLGRPLEPDEAR